MSQRSRERLRRMRDRRARDARTESVEGAIKLAGFGAAILVFVAVAVGFRGGEAGDGLAARFERLVPLLEPALFGMTRLELAMLAIAGLLVALFLWRRFRD
ncbi:hypothetical protein E5163_08995 [Marinicauda algicola]|uniref:Uncharacterized protein n=1 Tax=Marinicauda algicola TaxID=2029849 RepID=A0A4S2H143_9PROT|nr:hypothetical protein [Marinicauda algicola]TGY89245.1 hypothetical protein E5163_08995 [Marinicauda algicola]